MQHAFSVGRRIVFPVSGKRKAAASSYTGNTAASLVLLKYSDGFCCVFVFFVVLAAADGFVAFAFFFKALFVTAVTVSAVAVTVEGDLEILLENGVCHSDHSSNAYDGTDDHENGLQGTALLVFHIIYLQYPGIGFDIQVLIPFSNRKWKRFTG
jgi:hypothetical protein